MILGLLREGTAFLHERVERTVDLPNRLRSRTTYTSLLARLYGFHAPLEDRLAGVEVVGLDLAARRKADLLRDDLAALGLTGSEIDTLPRDLDLPAVADVSDALGCLYVLEGATLGGQVVRRLAEPAIGVTPDRGCAFFASYGERVGAMWKEFCRILESYAETHPSANNRIVTTATETFAGLDRWLAAGVGR